MILLRQFLCAIIIFMLYACFGGSGSSYEFNSAKTYARIDKDLNAAEEWGIKALEIEPNNALIPYFLATEVYRPRKKYDKVAQMYMEALKRTENLTLDRPFKVGDYYINNVHEAIKNEAFIFYNEGTELYKKGKTDKAFSKFELSMNLNPNILQNYIALSDIAYENNDIEKAIDYLDKGSKINSNNDLKIRKAKYARDNKNYDLALATLNDITTDDLKLKMLISREEFIIFLEQEDYITAIELGTILVDKMFSALDVEDMVLSEACYNLAICNRFVGYELYNSVLKTINDAQEDKELIAQAIENGEKAIKYLNDAKEKFFDASSFNPDDNNSIEYAKELSTILKQLKDLFIPSLKESLKN